MSRYYDYVLGLIPAALIGVTAFLNLVGLSLTAAVPVGAGIALALMGHAMFVRAPLGDATRAATRSPSGTASPSDTGPLAGSGSD
ncbi:hypothetical protein SAMN04488066_10530 [Halorubrum aquaticum]|uniref:Uncharacterized protein n=1 Tax=Halorubrum aquaticum TaxID=387340 RepID=A0A1I3ABK4_9EURY|nr:hypothetical protein [Halorubrum aquaticum]SFH47315.1 hypothetical protein SAMN04488066_10530 [Halorubrum aquaticum]